MMKPLLGLFFILLCGSIQAFGQDDTFKVIVQAGHAEVKLNSVWLQLKNGTLLKLSDEIKLGEGAYVGLRHSSGRVLEFTKAGHYNLPNLEPKLKTRLEPKLTSCCGLDFIISVDSSLIQKKKLSPKKPSDMNSIILFKPVDDKFSYVYGDRIVIDWNDLNKISPYIVVLRSLFSNELTRIETNNTFVSIDLTSELLAKENQIFIQIISKNSTQNHSDERLIKRLSLSDRKNVMEKLGLEPFSDEEKAINKYAMAFFFENEGLLLDAITFYQAAILLQPIYHEVYLEFLIRNDIK